MNIIAEVLLIGGIGCVGVGVWMLGIPGGLLIGGVILLAAGVALSRPRKRS